MFIVQYAFEIQLQDVERMTIVAVRTRVSNATACRRVRHPPAVRTQYVMV